MAAVIAAASAGAAAGAGAALADVGEEGYIADSNGAGVVAAPWPPEEEHHHHSWVPWLWALLVALLIGGTAAAAYFITRPEKRVVPAVTGEQVNVARTVVQNAGFGVSTIQVPSNQTAGIVIGENPGAGIKADKGSTVSLTVSQGPGKQAVPSVQGLSQSRATKAIKNAHLKVARVVMQNSSRWSVGEATGTDPSAGTSVPFDSGVTLFVSSGPAPKSVPDVTGQTQSDATQALESAGFKVSVTTQTSSSTTAGDVISQSPSAGAAEARGTTVTLVVASAPATNTVPPVVGDPADGAASALQAAGFAVQRRTQKVTNQNQDGTVISQSPAGGTTADKNSTVTIVVGKFSAGKSSSTTSTTSSKSSTTSTTSSTTGSGKKT
jgi:serine/threonine-protein kinase